MKQSRKGERETKTASATVFTRQDRRSFVSLSPSHPSYFSSQDSLLVMIGGYYTTQLTVLSSCRSKLRVLLIFYGLYALFMLHYLTNRTSQSEKSSTDNKLIN